MASESDVPLKVEAYPVTSERWQDLHTLFGERGAYAGCWCTFWRIERTAFKRLKGQGTKDALKCLVEAGEVPGLLAYTDGQVIGWCGLGPREQLTAIEHSRIFKRVDEQPVWSIICFFVARPFRRRGVMKHLLTASLAYASAKGASIVEAYPLEVEAELNSFGGYMGIASTFREIGFLEVRRAPSTQVVMRYMLKKE